MGIVQPRCPAFACLNQQCKTISPSSTFCTVLKGWHYHSCIMLPSYSVIIWNFLLRELWFYSTWLAFPTKTKKLSGLLPVLHDHKKYVVLTNPKSLQSEKYLYGYLLQNGIATRQLIIVSCNATDYFMFNFRWIRAPQRTAVDLKKVSFYIL